MGRHKGSMQTEKTKEKISKKMEGHKNFNKELKGCFQKGHIPWDKGKKRIGWNINNAYGFQKGNHPRTEFKKGKDNIAWRDGISKIEYGEEWTKTLRRAIRERDNYVCQICSKLQEDKCFDIHHIDYDKKNNNPKNLITLCRKCHIKTNSNREYWTKYFQNRIEVKQNE